MFPFTIKNPSQSSPVGQFFLENKPEDMSWYEIDLEVTSTTTGVFNVFHLDYVRCDGESYACRGEEVEVIPVTFKKQLVKKYIDERLNGMAIVRRQKELADEEKRIIALYVEEERVKLGL